MPEPTTTAPLWDRLVRFIAEDDQEYSGQPEDSELDIGLAIANGQTVTVKVLDSKSALDESAKFTGETKTIKKLLSPITATEAGTIRCIGLNYVDHAAEMNIALPKVPEVFLKPSTCLYTPTDPITLPSTAASEVDAEVELALVISKDCKNASIENALDYVLGYTVANDLTARDVQRKISQWGYAKGFDQFCPLGPTLVSAKRLPDPSVLLLKTVLNGKTMQDGQAANLIFSVAHVISYLSQGTTLPKGTVVLTGTPAGIGASHNPPIYLRAGDELRVSISHGLGTLVNSIASE